MARRVGADSPILGPVDRKPRQPLRFLLADDPGAGKTVDAVVVLKAPRAEGDRLTFDVDVLEGDLPGADGAAAVFIDIIGMPRTPLSFAGAARRTAFRGAWYAGAGLAGAAALGAAAAAAPYYYGYHPYYYGYHPYAYRAPCGYYPYPPCY